MKINLETKYQAITATWDIAELSLKQMLSFSDKTLLYFYPRDNTPWCTVENKDFSCLKEEFTKKWITLIWVSKDSIESHKKFIEQHNLQVDLVSDPDLILHKELEAYGEKNNYWKIVLWVIRSTFLLNKKGEVLQKWKGIRAKWHAERVLKEV
jgi:peroxiredoxin Q/BCP